MSIRLEEMYKKDIRENLKKELGLKNIMQVPYIKKIVVNIGVKDAVSDSKSLNLAKEVIDQVTGQSSVKTKAKKSIAGFKLREGMPIGVMVTLRKKKMYEFLDRLINLALPRTRDFQGVTTKFDGHGNYNLGIVDWMIFPEVDYEKVEISRGVNVTIETSTSKDEEARALLKSLNMPFQKN
jgi:large subunit ribosomal protein L5